MLWEREVTEIHDSHVLEGHSLLLLFLSYWTHALPALFVYPISDCVPLTALNVLEDSNSSQTTMTYAVEILQALIYDSMKVFPFLLLEYVSFKYVHLICYWNALTLFIGMSSMFVKISSICLLKCRQIINICMVYCFLEMFLFWLRARYTVPSKIFTTFASEYYRSKLSL